MPDKITLTLLKDFRHYSGAGSMAAFRWEEVTAQELRDFDLEHPWVKRWERRWGVK